MKIWVDDLRPPPAEEEWTWCKASSDAIWVLRGAKASDTTISYMSLDHDLGGDDTTRPVLLWMIENEFWPNTVVVHSMNPVGRHWLESMIDRYKL